MLTNECIFEFQEPLQFCIMLSYGLNGCFQVNKSDYFLVCHIAVSEMLLGFVCNI